MSERPELEHDFTAAAQEEVDAIMQKYDRESAFRTLTGFRGAILSVILILFSMLQLYSTWRIIPSTHMRPIHLGIVLMLAYLLYPARRKSRKDRLPWYDAVLAVLSLAIYLYQVVNFSKIAMQFGYTDFQLYLGLAGIILLL